MKEKKYSGPKILDKIAFGGSIGKGFITSNTAASKSNSPQFYGTGNGYNNYINNGIIYHTNTTVGQQQQLSNQSIYSNSSSNYDHVQQTNNGYHHHHLPSVPQNHPNQNSSSTDSHSIYASWSNGLMSGGTGIFGNYKFGASSTASSSNTKKKERGRIFGFNNTSNNNGSLFAATKFNAASRTGSDDNVSIYSSGSSSLQTPTIEGQNFNSYQQPQPIYDYPPLSGFTGSNNDIANATEDEINHKFESMLDDMNLSEERKAPLRNRDIKMKREMLSMHLRGVSHKGAVKAAGPADYTKFLSHNDMSPSKLLRWLESLRVALKSNPVSWVREFGPNGLSGLLANLAKVYDRVPTECNIKIQHECIRCLKAFMNNKYGLSAVIHHPDALILMAKSIDPRFPGIMHDTVKIFAAFCLIPPDGHFKVLQALTVCWEDNGIDRFQPILMGLQTRENLNLQISCIQFINAIISTPEDLDFRLHLRNEFCKCGLSPIIDELIRSEIKSLSAELSVQLDVYIDQREEDREELCHRYDEIKFEYEDPDECYRVLKHSFTRQPVLESSFLALMQYLLCLKDEDSKLAYYRLIETCVSQIVLHKNGIDPDYKSSRKFRMNVEPIIDIIMGKSESGSLDGHNSTTSSSSLVSGSLYYGNNRKANAAYEEAVAARHEAEAKITVLENKLREVLAAQNIQKDSSNDNGDSVRIHENAYPNSNTQQRLGPVPPPPPPPPPPPSFGRSVQEPPKAPFPPPPPLPHSRLGGGPPLPPPFPNTKSDVDTAVTPTFSTVTNDTNKGRFNLAPLPVPPNAPPPSGIPEFLKPKARYQPDKKLKRVNWTKIPAQKLSQESFWTSVQEDQLANSDLFRQIVSRFSISNNHSRRNRGAGTEYSTLSPTSGLNDDTYSTISENHYSTITSSTNAKVKQLKVLDPKSAQNLSICLGSIKLPYEVIRDSFLSLSFVDTIYPDTNTVASSSRTNVQPEKTKIAVLNEPIIQQLIKYMPEQAKIDTLAAQYTNFYDNINEAEQFLITISPIKRIIPRLKCVCFKMKFTEIVGDLKPSIIAVSSSCEQLRKSKKFAQILQLILLIGNYMNSGSNNAQSHGFEINFLAKLQNTKSEDQTCTLLHFLVQIVNDRYPEFKDFYHELTYIEKGTKVCQENISKSLNQMSASIKLLQNEIESCSRDPTYDVLNDKFLKIMKDFYGIADEQYTLLRGMFEKMETSYNSLGIYFCFDSKKIAVEEFFADIQTFITNFKKIQSEFAKAREAEEKTRKTRETRDKVEKDKRDQTTKRKAIVDMNSDGDQEGVMDSLLEALQSGTAFHKTTRRRLSKV